jgi:kumamolisin
MAFKKYVEVAGSERKPMQGAIRTGHSDPNEVMQVTLVLRQRTTGGKQTPLADLVARGQRVSREEYEARYGADPTDVHKVLAFATQFGLALANVNMPARTVALSGTCAAFSQAFQVQLASYNYKGGSYRGRSGAVKVPQELSSIIRSVHGLDNRPQAETHFRIASKPSGSAKPAATAGFLHCPASRPGIQLPDRPERNGRDDRNHRTGRRL